MMDNYDLIYKFQSAEDAESLANFITSMHLSETNQHILFTGRMLNSMAYSEKTIRYKTFSIPKKSGGERVLSAPVKDLKKVQKALSIVFQLLYSDKGSATGFIKEHSIVDNAKRHIGKRYVLNLDLKDFFPNISEGRIFKMLQTAPFNLNERVASLVACLCCEAEFVNGKRVNGHLPQGAPTSPILTNFVCRHMDEKLRILSRRYHVEYSRYADDMTFSSDFDCLQKSGLFFSEVFKIVGRENFKINEEKTRLQGTAYRQEVTGIIVNSKMNVPKSFIKDIRIALHSWEKLGYDKANVFYISNHSKPGMPVVNMNRSIGGKLNYLRMVKGPEDSTYQKLVMRFDKLVDNKKTVRKKKDIVDSPMNSISITTMLNLLSKPGGLKNINKIK